MVPVLVRGASRRGSAIPGPVWRRDGSFSHPGVGNLPRLPRASLQSGVRLVGTGPGSCSSAEVRGVHWGVVDRRHFAPREPSGVEQPARPALPSSATGHRYGRSNESGTLPVDRTAFCTKQGGRAGNRARFGRGSGVVPVGPGYDPIAALRHGGISVSTQPQRDHGDPLGRVPIPQRRTDPRVL